MQGGAVRNLRTDGDKVTAQVKGTYVYQVSLDLSGEFSAYCDCPAAQYQMCCKHAVAVALSLQSPDQVSDLDNERQLIKSYLKNLGEEAVIETLLDYLEHDEQRWDSLLTKIKLKQNAPAYGELKKLITKALPRARIWDWRESSGYFYSAEQQLSMIFDSIASLQVDQQWKLMSYLVERLNKVLEHIDDSNGDRFGIEELINVNMTKIFAGWTGAKRKKPIGCLNA